MLRLEILTATVLTLISVLTSSLPATATVIPANTFEASVLEKATVDSSSGIVPDKSLT
ncbi:hypothetical protein BC629DRAFT_1591290 [Irpex lacteus]|nr:hypothetical protein BC629DRAFT_1591290 [Irpex lacteus]